MHPRTRALALVVWLSTTPAAGAPGDPQTSAAGPDLRVPADGKTLYESACLGCHGPDGRGMPRSTVGFDLALPDFTDCAFATPEPDADWLTIVAHGGPVRAFDRRMPAFGSVLDDDEIARILAYIRTMCPDDAWPRGELNLPRPLRTEKAFPENEAVLTTTFDTTAANRVSNEFLYERRVGSRSQWEVKVPLDARGAGAGGWQAGLGDISLGFKRVLGHSLRRGAILSAGGEVVLPTGKEQRGLGSGTTTFEPFLVYGQILPHDAFIQAHTAVELPTDTDRASREAFWRVAAGRTFAAGGGAGRAWSPMLELLGARDLEAGAPVRWDVVPQVQVTLSRRQHVMLNAGVQLPVSRRAGRGARFITYLLWDWWDGGFFEGW
jgi:mono/diheme cytochrome c family protein